jgi:prepilin-type N-terminal cleavage/methylation domain-containing protein
MLQFHSAQGKKGFTLIEMIVAVGVFTVAITISLASFLNITAIQRKTSAMRTINDNLNFSLEIMMREIRSGTNYKVGGGGTSLAIVNNYKKNIVYSLNTVNNQIERSEEGGPAIALTAPEVKITKLFFVVDSTFQPRVTVVVNGETGENEKSKSVFNLQTTISQRQPK